MAGPKRNKIKEHQLEGFKYFKILSNLLETLHSAARARDPEPPP